MIPGKKKKKDGGCRVTADCEKHHNPDMPNTPQEPKTYNQMHGTGGLPEKYC